MSTVATIQASIDSIDAEIAKLTEARDTLSELLGAVGDNGEAVEEAKPVKRSRRATAKAEADEPKATSKRAPASKRSARKASSNGDGEKGPSRKEQIAALLEEGMTPREIADELGIATNYVYNVKREL